MKFLVVDDSPTTRRIVVNCLRRIGHEDVLEAANGEEALAAFDDSVGFVITDWNMPKMDGITLARAIRGRPSGVPILIVTTRGAREDILTAVQAGVNNYVVKPFTPALLKEKIDAAMGG